MNKRSWLFVLATILLVVSSASIISAQDNSQQTYKVIVELQDPALVPPSYGGGVEVSAKSFQQNYVSSFSSDPEIQMASVYENVFYGFAAEVTNDKLFELQNNPAVKHIYPDTEVHSMLAQSVPLIGSDVVDSLGYNGTGVTLCVLDTGYDVDHPDINRTFVGAANCTSGTCISSADGSNNLSVAYDDHGHGSHVTGIINVNGTTVNGTARDTSLLEIKVLNSSASGLSSWLIAGVDFCIGNGTAKCLVMSLGLGYSPSLGGSGSSSSTIDYG